MGALLMMMEKEEKARCHLGIQLADENIHVQMSVGGYHCMSCV